MSKVKVLFVCIHNSTRSQMAEAWLNTLYHKDYEAVSVGIEPGILNPLVVKSMAEVGIDISGKQTQSVFELIARETSFSYLITVCDETNAEKCPTFSGSETRLHWSFSDPSKLEDSDEEKLTRISVIRDQIKDRVQQWVDYRRDTEVAE